jgi:ABC-2 type transport system ATP-binding protein
VDVELRQGLWDFVRQLNRDGHTIVLTTHYLDEAEMLCQRVGMLKQGRLVALDATQNLLKGFSGLQLRLRLAQGELPPALVPLQASAAAGGEYVLSLADYVQLEQVLAELRKAGREFAITELSQPDLEEVFVSIMRKA